MKNDCPICGLPVDEEEETFCMDCRMDVSEMSFLNDRDEDVEDGDED